MQSYNCTTEVQSLAIQYYGKLLTIEYHRKLGESLNEY